MSKVNDLFSLNSGLKKKYENDFVPENNMAILYCRVGSIKQVRGQVQLEELDAAEKFIVGKNRDGFVSFPKDETCL